MTSDFLLTLNVIVTFLFLDWVDYITAIMNRDNVESFYNNHN